MPPRAKVWVRIPGRPRPLHQTLGCNPHQHDPDYAHWCTFPGLTTAIHSSTPSFLRAHQITLRGTKSNAFSRSTKAIFLYHGRVSNFKPSVLGSNPQQRKKWLAFLKLSIKKCYFMPNTMHFLGHVVSDSGVETDPDKIEKVKNWPMPKNTTFFHA